MFKTADFFDTAPREQIQANLFCYGRAVVALDWPAMGRETRSARVDELGGYLENDMRALAPREKVQEAALSDLFSEAGTRTQARSDRLAGADAGVPAPVWIVLIVGALGVISYVLLFADPKERFLSQSVMVGSVVAILVGGLMLVWFLSHPYGDEPGSITPVAMKRTLAEAEHDPAFETRTVSPYCDREGLPLFSGS